LHKYLKYLSYIFKHKWFVFCACLKCGLIWQGIIHDLSKLYLDEFFGYAEYFYGSKMNLDMFDKAWMNHQRRNPHHWQYWTLLDERGVVSLKVPLKYLKEMVCDWIGANQSKDNASTPLEWYTVNKDRIYLHPDSRLWIEKELENGNNKEDDKQYNQTSRRP